MCAVFVVCGKLKLKQMIYTSEIKYRLIFFPHDPAANQKPVGMMHAARNCILI